MKLYQKSLKKRSVKIVSYSIIAIIGAGMGVGYFYAAQKVYDQVTAKNTEQQSSSCGIKEIRIEPVRDNVKQINAVIKNFGGNVAKSVSLTWYIDVIEGSRAGKPIIKKISSIPAPITTPPIDIIGGQEVPTMLVQFNRTDFNNIVRGDIDSLMRISISLEYQNINDKKQPYLFVYHITRLADVKKDGYEVALIKSDLR
jgi:hypothetical protein